MVEWPHRVRSLAKDTIWSFSKGQLKDTDLFALSTNSTTLTPDAHGWITKLRTARQTTEFSCPPKRVTVLCLTLSTCGCQYSSCCVFAVVLLILEKKVGLVRYICFGSRPNVSAITPWIRPRTSLNDGKRTNCIRLKAKSNNTYYVFRPYVCSNTHKTFQTH